MNINYIMRLVYTHPENKGRSIRYIARMLNMNSGSVYRILKQLGLVTPLDLPTSPAKETTIALAKCKNHQGVPVASKCSPPHTTRITTGTAPVSVQRKIKKNRVVQRKHLQHPRSKKII